MDLGKMALFTLAKTRMDHISQRQKVLAQNIANSDTPGYRARDLRPLDFKRMAIDSRDTTPSATRTHAMHAKGALPDRGPFRVELERRPFEESIDGNEIVLEEQLQKYHGGERRYQLALSLVRKNVQMLKAALGQR